MKKLILLSWFMLIFYDSFSQPVVYFNFLSHNEETSQWNGTPYYLLNRGKLISLANYFQANGITWNLQSDWVYLTNVIQKDTSYVANTNNKNILRWLHEDKGVELDPHAHESQYIYPDVVKLMDSLGLPESKVIGGSIYNDSNGVNIWINLVNGQYGIIFPDFFWLPDYMMGGGTPNHVADLNYYGFWNPQDTAHYLVHDTTSRLRDIGVGCAMKITNDTVPASTIITALKDVIQNVQSGAYPDTGFYLQTIFFEQADLNNTTFYAKLLEVADSANALVASGVAEWKTLKQAYTQWETADNAQMFQWECGQVLTSAEELKKGNNIRVYPNPASDKLKIEMSGTSTFKNVELTVYNLLGSLVLRSTLNSSITQLDINQWQKGIYFCRLKTDEKIFGVSQIVIQ